MQRENVGLGQQLVQTFDPPIADRLFMAGGLKGIETDDVIAERLQAVDHAGADATDADNAGGQGSTAPHRRQDIGLPAGAVTAGPAIIFEDPPLQHEDQGHGAVGHLFGAVIGIVGESDAGAGESVDIDIVIADAEAGHHAATGQAGRGCRAQRNAPGQQGVQAAEFRRIEVLFTVAGKTNELDLGAENRLFEIQPLHRLPDDTNNKFPTHRKNHPFG